MPVYLSSQTLKESVERLAISSTTSRLADYLIFKRALKNRKDDERLIEPSVATTVVTGTRSAHFVKAIQEFALRIPPGEVEQRSVSNPYYIPFGAKRDKANGYRSVKFPSNGPSVTVGGWQSGDIRPFKVVPGTSPKEFELTSCSSKELEAFFIIKSRQDNSSGEKPRLLDTAVWWFRFTDLEERFNGEPTAENLTEGFAAELDLNAVEIAACFMPLNTGQEAAVK